MEQTGNKPFFLVIRYTFHVVGKHFALRNSSIIIDNKEKIMKKQEILLESGTNELELLTFLLGNQSFGLNVLKVQSIMQYDPSSLTKIPKSPHTLMGMLLYRDRTIPLIDLSAALDLKNRNDNNKKQIVIVTEFNNVVNGFLVDGVNRIHRLSWSSFVPLTTAIGNVSDSITGSIQIDGTEIMVVDLEYILSVISPNLAISNISYETLNSTRSESREEVRIFFAEDSGIIRNNVIRILKKSGYGNVRDFDNGQKALDTLMEISNKVDTQGEEDDLPHVVISDIEMPQMDGLTLCRKIKDNSKLKQITVIMFSSLINDQMINKCKSVGADSYITKPEMDKLVSMLDKMCLNSKKTRSGDLVLTH